MKFGIHVPNLGSFGDPRTLAGLARTAEVAGWDGFFLWDHILGDPAWRHPMVDPWVALGAMADRTDRIRIGPLVTAIPRRRPWKLARESVTVDHLSGGRLVLGVGLGWPPEAEYEHFGEDGSLSGRARRLDEGLAIIAGLWKGESFSLTGEEYRIRETVFLPRPVQHPRIPIWVAAHLPNQGPLRRAARWDGVFPVNPGGGRVTPGQVEGSLRLIRAQRPEPEPFDVVVGGIASELAPDELDALGSAGVTWWLESFTPADPPAQVRERIAAGPPGAVRSSEA
jgi:alkanesulfonate monooxygenase SsuD/methylene tetrahydromethanopterin reductase-like flavin-dependent oxidoreductase (luciferase family)